MTEDKAMRLAIYARVSTQDQDCAQQLTALREYAAARQWPVAGEYVDDQRHERQAPGSDAVDGRRETAQDRCHRGLEDRPMGSIDATLRGFGPGTGFARRPVHRHHTRNRHRHQQSGKQAVVEHPGCDGGV